MNLTPDINIARRGRWAAATMFLANGFIVGSWAPHIPLLMTRLGIGETTLGLLILVFGLGALAAMPWCGYLMARHGSRAILRVFAFFTCLALPVVALAPDIVFAAPAMFLLGGTIGAMDVAMNTNAVAVEKRLGRAVMSSSHGFWSLGGFLGGASGGFAIEAVGYLSHAMLVGVVALVLVGVAMRFLVADVAAAAHEPRSFSLPANPLVYLIGLVALFSMIPEGAVLDWAALHLREALGANIAIAGLAFAVFSGTMAVMRFVGDGVRNRFGAVNTMRVSSLVAAIGMLVAGLSSEPWMAIASFGFAGLGIANMVPIAFSAAGNQDGIASSTGMSVVTTMGYSGILVAPSAIGFIGERIGFSPVFMGLSVLLLVVCAMAGLARSADFAPRSPG